jgi:hypothetical protein
MKKWIYYLIPAFIVALVLTPNVRAQSQQLFNSFITNWPELQSVQVENFPETQKVELTEEGSLNVNTKQDVQQWQYWYQCHPTMTNEAEIRDYLNARGLQGMEVVAAAASGSMICEYYKRPLVQ